MKLYQTTHGYDLITSDKRLFSLWQSTNDWTYQFKGTVNEKYNPAGTLLKSIPNYLKRYVFKLNKNGC